jgi:hypothetical protein
LLARLCVATDKWIQRLHVPHIPIPASRLLQSARLLAPHSVSVLSRLRAAHSVSVLSRLLAPHSVSVLSRLRAPHSVSVLSLLELVDSAP